jgi:hypothetical protein
MKTLFEWDEEDFKRFKDLNQQENQSIEYKKAETLDFGSRKKIGNTQQTLGDKHREEFLRDIAAMANAEGGRIYFGIKADKDGFPKILDEGFETVTLNADGIEQILLTNIFPRLEGILVHSIKRATNGKFWFVIDIPKATRNAPHQTPDNRYHRRHVRTKLAMGDSEVRDAMKRSIEYGRQFGAAWDLQVESARLISAIQTRLNHDPDYWAPRDRLIIRVFEGIRAGGGAMILLPKTIRDDAAKLVTQIDSYNSIIETIDPGQKDLARISEARKTELSEMLIIANKLSASVKTVLNQEP